MKDKEKIENMASCLLSILDYLKLQDNCKDDSEDMLQLNDETLSEMMFRKMKAYNIDLNKELGFTHLRPVDKDIVCGNCESVSVEEKDDWCNKCLGD